MATNAVSTSEALHVATVHVPLTVALCDWLMDQIAMKRQELTKGEATGRCTQFFRPFESPGYEREGEYL